MQVRRIGPRCASDYVSGGNRRVAAVRLNPQDGMSDSIDEQIVPAPLILDENIEMNLEENDELVQPFLRMYSSEDISVSAPSARPRKKRRRKRMAQGSCSARSDLYPLTVAWEAQRALMLGKVGELLRD